MHENRQNIINIALNLFALKGYESVGVQKIVDHAKVTKPTLYYYFGNKKGLLDAILDENFTVLIKDLKGKIDLDKSLEFNLAIIAHSFFEFGKSHSLFYRFQLNLFFSPPENETHKTVLHFNSIIFGIVESVFHKEFGLTSTRRVSAKYAFTFIGIINNYISLYLSGLLALDEQAEKDAVNQFLFGIIKK